MRSLSEFYDSTPSLKEKYGLLIADYGLPSKVFLLEGQVENFDHEGKPLSNTHAFAFVYDDFHDPRTTVYAHRKSIKKVWGKPSLPNQPITEIPFTIESHEFLHRRSIGGSPGMISEDAGLIQQLGESLDFSHSNPTPNTVVFTIPKCPKAYIIPLITFEDQYEDDEADLLALKLESDGSFSLQLKTPIQEKDIMSKWLTELGIAFDVS